MKRCLNCGKKLSNNDVYCRFCGQDASTSLLSSKNFIVDTLLRLTRLNKGFLYTCFQLLVRPWTVIRDYIRGKRVRYTAPVQMLIVLCFLYVVVRHFFEEEPVDIIESMGIPHEESTRISALKYFLKFYFSSPSLQYIILFLPALPVMRLVFRKQGADKYNMAEYLVAGLYMSDTMLCLEILTLPLDRYVPELPSMIFLVIGTLAVYKAFLSKSGSVWYRVRRILLYLFTTLFFYLILLALLGTIYFFTVRGF